MNTRWLSFGMVGLGLALSVWGLLGIRRTMDFRNRGVITQATITHLDRRLDSPNDPIEPWHKADSASSECYRTIIFHTPHGRRVVKQSALSVVSQANGPGVYYTHVPEDQLVRVRYDPLRPDDFQMANVAAQWVVPYGFVVAGLLLLFAAAAMGSEWPFVGRLIDRSAGVAAAANKLPRLRHVNLGRRTRGRGWFVRRCSSVPPLPRSRGATCR